MIHRALGIVVSLIVPGVIEDIVTHLPLVTQVRAVGEADRVEIAVAVDVAGVHAVEAVSFGIDTRHHFPGARTVVRTVGLELIAGNVIQILASFFEAARAENHALIRREVPAKAGAVVLGVPECVDELQIAVQFAPREFHSTPPVCERRAGGRARAVPLRIPLAVDRGFRVIHGIQRTREIHDAARSSGAVHHGAAARNDVDAFKLLHRNDVVIRLHRVAYERRDRSAVKQHLDIPRRLIRALATDINLTLTRRVD